TKHRLDEIHAKARRNAFRLISRTSDACGFEPAVEAGEHLVEQGHPLDEASLTTMARRIASGEKPYEQTAPDLTGYDVFMQPRGTRERKEA
ncbi:IS21 family transposase, partial [Bifidobacterium breve]|nr:IS21 family transposase [Bifidobacterium breve]